MLWPKIDETEKQRSSSACQLNPAIIHRRCLPVTLASFIFISAPEGSEWGNSASQMRAQWELVDATDELFFCMLEKKNWSTQKGFLRWGKTRLMYGVISDVAWRWYPKTFCKTSKCNSVVLHNLVLYKLFIGHVQGRAWGISGPHRNVIGQFDLNFIVRTVDKLLEMLFIKI